MSRLCNLSFHKCRAAICWFTSPNSSAHRRPIRLAIRSKKAFAGWSSFYAENANAGRQAVAIVDEAQLLEDCGALETLRLLLNFEDAGRPALALIFVGQTSLLSAVGRLPSLEERISVKAMLRAFTPDETAGYVRHRLTAAGATRDIFTPDAVEALHYLSRGLARQINRLADLALLVGFADRLSRLDSQQIEAVSEELVTVGAES